MRQATAERTRGERDRKERRRAEKEWAKLNAQCAATPAVTTAHPTRVIPGGDYASTHPEVGNRCVVSAQYHHFMASIQHVASPALQTNQVCKVTVPLV